MKWRISDDHFWACVEVVAWADRMDREPVTIHGITCEGEIEKKGRNRERELA
jgi:hypothetical protein